MNEVEKILYKLGYGNSDPLKTQEVEGYVAEAEEFMLSKGIDESNLKSKTAFVIKSLWASYRDRGDDEEIIKREGMITHLLLDLRRR